MTVEKIKLKDLMRVGQKELDLSETYDYNELPTVEPVTVEAHIQLTSTGVDVRGRFRAVVEEPCDRCSAPYRRELSQRFNDRYVYAALVDAHPIGGEMELHTEDFYDTIGPDGILDVKDLVYQHIIIALSSDRVCEQETCIING